MFLYRLRGVSVCPYLFLDTIDGDLPILPTAFEPQKQAEEEEEFVREQERYEREAREAQDKF